MLQHTDACTSVVPHAQRYDNDEFQSGNHTGLKPQPYVMFSHLSVVVKGLKAEVFPACQAGHLQTTAGQNEQ